MFEFFDTILNFLKTVIDIVVGMFEMLVYVITYIVQGIFYISTCAGYLPSWVAAFILPIVSYVVIITMINKGE